MVRGWLVGAARLLGDQRNSALVVGLDRHGLVVDEACVLSRVLVRQVERVARELDTASGTSLDEESIVVS